MRIREGVTASVNAKMEAVNANILREDGVLFRTCDHNVRHPVGCIHTGRVPYKTQREHDSRGCCAERCCDRWATDAVKAS